MGLLKSYLRFMGRYPISAQIVQTGLLMGLGDVISQTVIEKTKFSELDRQRTKRFFIIGWVVTGPMSTVWYYILKRAIPEKQGVPKIKIGLKKMLFDQLVFCPISACIFLTALNYLKGKNWGENVKDIKETAPVILKANYAVWPLVQIINFTFVPYQIQVVFVQTVAIFWNTFVSFVVNKKK